MAKVEVSVEELRESHAGSVSERPSVVIETGAVVNGQRRDTSIEVFDADASSVATALLNVDIAELGTLDALPIAVQCLAAGVVEASTAQKVRLHLQCESGQVLPIEMSREAAAALARALAGSSAPG